MASKLVLVVFAVATAAILSNGAMAMEYVVGDEQGWRPGFNYTAWAEGKQFFVGDSLVFKYTPGAHDVYKVSGPEFQACQAPKGVEGLTSGNDVIAIATSGRKWYICSVTGHCDGGQKLVITVQESSAMPMPSPSPAAAPPQSAGTTVCPYSAIVFAAVAVLISIFA